MKLENIEKAYELKQEYDSLVYYLSKIKNDSITSIKLETQKDRCFYLPNNDNLNKKIKDVIIENCTKKLEEIETELKELGVEIDG